MKLVINKPTSEVLLQEQKLDDLVLEYQLKQDKLLLEWDWNDVGHLSLDILGIVPGIGVFADVANAIWYFNDDKLPQWERWLFGGLSLISAVPVLGWISTSLKFLRSGGKAAGLSAKLAKEAPKHATKINAVLKKAGQNPKIGEKNAKGAWGAFWDFLRGRKPKVPPTKPPPAVARQAATAEKAMGKEVSALEKAAGEGTARLEKAALTKIKTAQAAIRTAQTGAHGMLASRAAIKEINVAKKAIKDIAAGKKVKGSLKSWTNKLKKAESRGSLASWNKRKGLADASFKRNTDKLFKADKKLIKLSKDKNVAKEAAEAALKKADIIGPTMKVTSVTEKTAVVTSVEALETAIKAEKNGTLLGRLVTKTGEKIAAKFAKRSLEKMVARGVRIAYNVYKIYDEEMETSFVIDPDPKPDPTPSPDPGPKPKRTWNHAEKCLDVTKRWCADPIDNDKTGALIHDIQKTLNNVVKAGLSVDGKFGPRTEKAVKSFQKVNGLKPDGIIGPETHKVLNTAGAKNMEPEYFKDKETAAEDAKELKDYNTLAIEKCKSRGHGVKQMPGQTALVCDTSKTPDGQPKVSDQGGGKWYDEEDEDDLPAKTITSLEESSVNKTLAGHKEQVLNERLEKLIKGLV